MTRSTPLRLFPLALALACSDAKDDETGAPQPLTDADGDGYYAEEDDCDDADLYVRPGATETCDEVDNDCDGAVDEDVATTYYADADGDGFGDPDVTLAACARPDGYSTLNTDCDDADTAIFPGGSEVCDGADNDCDGLVDDADDSVDTRGGVSVYPDSDGDGFGDPDIPVLACAPGEGTTEDASDCDDADPEIRPDAAEACDGVDNDCDGRTDDADDAVTGTITAHVDADGDGYGSATETVEVCAYGDGAVEDSTDCDDTLDSVSPGAVESCLDEVDNDCDSEINEACVGCGDLSVVSYYDSYTAGSTPIDAAADLGGFSLTASSDSDTFAAAYDDGAWDVLIVDVPGSSLPTAVLERIASAISDGTVVLFSYWYLGYDMATAELLGVTVDSSYNAPLPLSAAAGSTLWSAYETLPASIENNSHDAGTNGQVLSPVDSATSETLGVYSGDDSSEAILATYGGQVIVNGFLFWDFQATDDDADGVYDMAELYVNEIAWALGCSP